MESYHYPPEVLNLLVDTIPLLCRAKNDVLVFFRGAGIAESVMKDLAMRVKTDKENINKYEIARTVIQRINEKGDSGLRARREIIKRVVEFEEFSSCWPGDQLKAKGLVADIRKIVNVKDSFSRMAHERERERLERIQIKQAEIAEKKKKIQQIENVKKELYSLFSLENQPQKRGKQLEYVLNALFSAYGVLIEEDFKRVDPEGAGILEQVDGVIEFSGHIYFVEMKWVKEPIGVEKISQHLVRIYGRDARGLFIASNGYADTAITICREALNKEKTIVLVSLQEIVNLLERHDDLTGMLQQKINAAIIDKKPFVEILN